jgi:peptidoglycan/LPS O-acetylase OafA/YrhL
MPYVGRAAVPPAAPPAPAGAGVGTSATRLGGLDGLRGLAALFVVLHHCYLVSFPGFPANTGPRWAAFLLYGHLAVAVFIALSGFSLAVAPARNRWHLGGVRRFAHRRAWRILPPYWAALVFSLAIAWAVVPQPGTPEPTARSVVVYGLLVQDIVGAPSPNGAFWSIAVEAQLYLVFPLMLLVRRRAGTVALVAAVSAVVAAIGLLAPGVPAVDLFMRLTPQFAALFAMGLVAAGVVGASERARRLPWHWLAALAAAPVFAVLVVRSSQWWEEHRFWTDFALGPAVALLLAGVATGRPRPLVRLLDTRPVRGLGRFSYSLYLIHAPIVVALHAKVVAPHIPPGLPALGVTLLVAVPVALLTSRLFAAVFEIPFQRYRSWASLRAAMRAWWAGRRRAAAPAAAAPASAAPGLAAPTAAPPASAAPGPAAPAPASPAPAPPTAAQQPAVSER